MALSDREEVFDVEVPAGTAKATPIEHSITFPPGTVVELQILFPAGCAGLVASRSPRPINLSFRAARALSCGATTRR